MRHSGGGEEQGGAGAANLWRAAPIHLGGLPIADIELNTFKCDALPAFIIQNLSSVQLHRCWPDFENIEKKFINCRWGTCARPGPAPARRSSGTSESAQANSISVIGVIKNNCFSNSFTFRSHRHTSCYFSDDGNILLQLSVGWRRLFIYGPNVAGAITHNTCSPSRPPLNDFLSNQQAFKLGSRSPAIIAPVIRFLPLVKISSNDKGSQRGWMASWFFCSPSLNDLWSVGGS